MLALALAMTVAAAPTPADRCGKVFDQLQPELERQWAKGMKPDELAAAKKDVPKLKAGFVAECSKLAEADIACAESPKAPPPEEVCKDVPETMRADCIKYERENGKADPLRYCKNVSDALDRAGMAWADARAAAKTKKP